MPSGTPNPVYNISPQDAEFIVDSFKIDGVELRYGQHSKLSPRDRAALAMHILHRRLNGERQTEIARSLDISDATVSRLKNEALDLIEVPTQDRARAEHIEWCDRIIDAFLPKAVLGDEKAAATVLKALGERAKSTGAYAPVEVTGTITEITPQEREMQDLIAQAERDAAMKAARLRGSAAPASTE